MDYQKNKPGKVFLVDAHHNQCDQKKNHQMSLKLPKNDVTRKMILILFQKLPKNVADLAKLTVAKGFKKVA